MSVSKHRIGMPVITCKKNIHNFLNDTLDSKSYLYELELRLEKHLCEKKEARYFILLIFILCRRW